MQATSTINFEEVWVPLARCEKNDCQVAKLVGDQSIGYVVQVGTYALAMQQLRDQFTAGAWQYVDAQWCLLKSLGNVENLAGNLNQLHNGAMPSPWLILSRNEQ